MSMARSRRHVRRRVRPLGALSRLLQGYCVAAVALLVVVGGAEMLGAPVFEDEPGRSVVDVLARLNQLLPWRLVSDGNPATAFLINTLAISFGASLGLAVLELVLQSKVVTALALLGALLLVLVGRPLLSGGDPGSTDGAPSIRLPWAPPDPASEARGGRLPPGQGASGALAALARPDPAFGLVEAYKVPDPALAQRLAVGYERLTFGWPQLQAAAGAALNPHYLPLAIVDGERAKGTQLVGLLVGTPAWAARQPADGPRSVPRNLDLAWDHADNYWGRFVERIARDYRGRVDDWIVWNEPDIQPGDPNASYYAFAGTAQDYYQMLRVAYGSAKKGNPAARVHLAGLTYWVDKRADRPQYFERLLTLMDADPTAAANRHYFDVATLHLYTDPRALYDVPRLYRKLMAERGLDKPIWVNETNVIPYDDPTNAGTGYDLPTGMRCTLDDQASYVLQAFGLALAGGVERMAVYKAVDSPGAALNGAVDAIERAALVRADGSPRPAFAAYETAVRHLRDAGAANYRPGPSVETVVVERPDSQRTTVLWNAGAAPVLARLAAAGARAELVDAAGRASPLAPAPDGDYAIPLPGATCRTDPDDPRRLLLGGETYLVAEYDVTGDQPPRSARAEP